MAFQLPQDQSFAAEGLFDPCAASPKVDGDFQGLVVNVPSRIVATSGELDVPLRGYLELPYDYGGLGDAFVEALSIVVVSAAPFAVRVTGVELPGSPLESLEATLFRNSCSTGGRHIVERQCAVSLGPPRRCL